MGHGHGVVGRGMNGNLLQPSRLPSSVELNTYYSGGTVPIGLGG